MMNNTRIDYLYRDADNYKRDNTCVVAGTITEEQKEAILDSLDDGEYFIPKLVGMPEKKFDTYDPQADHPFFELGPASFNHTDDDPTLELTVVELVERFRAHKEKWFAIDYDNALSMVRVLVDNLVNDEGGHSQDAIKRLFELGFEASELLCLDFQRSDIEYVQSQMVEEK